MYSIYAIYIYILYDICYIPCTIYDMVVMLTMKQASGCYHIFVICRPSDSLNP